jgi:hypothetical protein
VTANISEPSFAAEVAAIKYRLRRLERKPPQAQYEIKVFGDTQALAAGDGVFIWPVPTDVGGMHLSGAEAGVSTVSSSGDITVQIRNITGVVDMLLDPITIEAGDFNSSGAAVQPATDSDTPENALVARGDRIAIDVDAAGTGAMGLAVILTFRA